MEMKLSIIIVNWNTKNLLKDCLNSIFDNSPSFKFEVIVVDNASTDGSLQMVTDYFSFVKLISNDSNKGFSYANNRGIEKSIGQYILLLNSDTIVFKKALEDMVNFMDNNFGAGALGCRLLMSDGTIQPYIFGDDPTLSYLVKRNIRKLLRLDDFHNWKNPSSPPFNSPLTKGGHRGVKEGMGGFEVDWVTGACMMVKREAVEKAGLMDENIFMYFEDNDWCYRIRKTGFKIYYNPKAEIIHLGGKSLGENQTKRKSEYYKSLLYFYQKHYGIWQTLLLRFLLIPNKLFLKLRG
jgi:GT2 family glycosyltransferase